MEAVSSSRRAVLKSAWVVPAVVAFGSLPKSAYATGRGDWGSGSGHHGSMTYPSSDDMPSPDPWPSGSGSGSGDGSGSGHGSGGGSGRGSGRRRR